MNKNNEILESIVSVMAEVRRVKPLVHCITNRVTINDCANIVLAAGGSPAMVDDPREVEEFVSASQGLVLNLGIVSESVTDAMFKAGKRAKELGVPIIFDPVGVGALTLRQELSEQILTEIDPDIIRGNMSEIKSLAGVENKGKGVDAAAEDAVTEENAAQFGVIVKNLAAAHQAVVCATGAVDIISDGQEVYYIKNGNEMLCDVTGTGCMLSALCGAMCGTGELLNGTLAATVMVGLAGELAQEYVSANGAGIGTFHVKLLDYIYQMDAETVRRRGEVYHG